VDDSAKDKAVTAYTVEVLVFLEAEDAEEAEHLVTQFLAPGMGRAMRRGEPAQGWRVSDVRSDDQ
jgi:hypothetical protein